MVDRYQTTSHTPEALYRLVESYLTLGLLEEAKRNGAVLGYNYPGDPWYGDAYKLLTSKGLRAGGRAAAGRRGFMRLPFTKDKSQDRPAAERGVGGPPADAATPSTSGGSQGDGGRPRPDRSGRGAPQK